MASPSLSGASAIGRYFTVVSLVPSVVFVAYVTLLLRSGTWAGSSVDFAGSAAGLDVKDVALSGVASLLVALALHPLQFAVIQIFEGYWGSSYCARKFATRHIMRHRHRAMRLRNLATDKDLAARPPAQFDERGELRAQPPYATRVDAKATDVESFFTSIEAERLNASYPDALEHIMPTRLGNVLRRYEHLAGIHYGLDSISSVPRMLQVADPRDVAYVQNQRMQMELALRVATLALAAMLLTIVFMWRHGPWLLLALAPYAIAFASYRGAVVVAHEYGTALAVLIDLNRFAFYERIRLPLPDDLEEERSNNARLADVLSLDNVPAEKREAEPTFLDYVHPPPVVPVTLYGPGTQQSQQDAGKVDEGSGG